MISRATGVATAMSSLEFDILPDRVPDLVPDQKSLKTSRPRRSFVGSIRSKTSRFFGRNTAIPKNADITTTVDSTNTADITSAADIISIADSIRQPVQTSPVKTRRSWFNSVGTRFHRHGRRTILLSSDSEQCVHVELEDATGVSDQPSALERPRSPSPISRRLFGTRRNLRLQSLPSKLRRSTSVFRRSSSSLSDKGKENFVSPAPPAESSTNVATANTGSWSSFRSGVQRAVRGEWCCLPSPVHTNKTPRDGRRQLPLLRRPYRRQSVSLPPPLTSNPTPLTLIIHRHATHTPSPPQSPSQNPLDHNVSRLRVSPSPLPFPSVLEFNPNPSGNEIPRPPSPGDSSTKLCHFAEWSSPECWSPSKSSQNNYILVSPSPHNNTHTPNNTSETAVDAADNGGNGGEVTGNDDGENDDPTPTRAAPLSRACSASSAGSDSSSAFVSEPRSVVYHSPVSEAPSGGGSFRSWRRGSGSGGSRGLLLGSSSGTAGTASGVSGSGGGVGSSSRRSGGGVSGGKVRGWRGRGFLLDDVQTLLADIKAPVGGYEGNTRGRSQQLASPVGEGSSSSPVEEENQTGVLQEVGNAAAGRVGEGVGWDIEKEGGGCGCAGEEGVVVREGVRPRVVSYPAAAV